MWGKFSCCRQREYLSDLRYIESIQLSSFESDVPVTKKFSMEEETILKVQWWRKCQQSLGPVWDQAIDHLLFLFSVIESTVKHWRCAVLSIIVRFYDPLWLLGPVEFKAKIFIQQLAYCTCYGGAVQQLVERSKYFLEWCSSKKLKATDF